MIDHPRSMHSSHFGLTTLRKSKPTWKWKTKTNSSLSHAWNIASTCHRWKKCSDVPYRRRPKVWTLTSCDTFSCASTQTLTGSSMSKNSGSFLTSWRLGKKYWTTPNCSSLWTSVTTSALSTTSSWPRCLTSTRSRCSTHSKSSWLNSTLTTPAKLTPMNCASCSRSRTCSLTINHSSSFSQRAAVRWPSSIFLISFLRFSMTRMILSMLLRLMSL